MKFEVEMHAFGKGQIRTVTLPLDVRACLGAIFEFGQNDFQPQQMPSVSVGDIIRFNNERWVVMPVGFKKVSADFQPPADDRGGFYAYDLQGERS